MKLTESRKEPGRTWKSSQGCCFKSQKQPTHGMCLWISGKSINRKPTCPRALHFGQQTLRCASRTEKEEPRIQQMRPKNMRHAWFHLSSENLAGGYPRLILVGTVPYPSLTWTFIVAQTSTRAGQRPNTHQKKGKRDVRPSQTFANRREKGEPHPTKGNKGKQKETPKKKKRFPVKHPYNNGMGKHVS